MNTTTSIGDRINATLAWYALAQWYALVSEMIRREDMEAIPKVLALMAVHGHPDEAEELRQAILLVSRIEGGNYGQR